jgi:hypothetical protein
VSLSSSSIKRSTDATGDEILTLTTPGGAHVQGVALVDADGAQAGIAANPLPVADAAVLAALAQTYGTNDVVAASTTLTYVGKEKPDGAWLVLRLDTSSGTVIRYATVANNAGILGYAAAWAGRAGLSYGTWSEAV